MPYEVTRNGSTLTVTRTGTMTKQEAEEYVRDVSTAAAGMGSNWTALIDMRESKVMYQDAMAVVQQWAGDLFHQGARKIAVVQSSAVVGLQTTRLSDKVRKEGNVRVFDMQKMPAAMADAVKWLDQP